MITANIHEAKTNLSQVELSNLLGAEHMREELWEIAAGVLEEVDGMRVEIIEFLQKSDES